MFVAISVLSPLFVPATTEIEFVTMELPWAIVEKGYEAPPLEVRVSGSCPIGGVGYSVTSGALPPGMQLSRLGYLSGAPVHTGDFNVTIIGIGRLWIGHKTVHPDGDGRSSHHGDADAPCFHCQTGRDRSRAGGSGFGNLA